MSDDKPERVMVTVSFTDGTRDMQLPLPINYGPELPSYLTVHSNPPRVYDRVYANVYTPRKA